MWWSILLMGSAWAADFPSGGASVYISNGGIYSLPFNASTPQTLNVPLWTSGVTSKYLVWAGPLLWTGDDSYYWLPVNSSNGYTTGTSFYAGTTCNWANQWAGGASGTLYCWQQFGYYLYKLTPTGSFITQFYQSSVSYSLYRGMIVDEANNTVYASFGTVLYRFNLATGVIISQTAVTTSEITRMTMDAPGQQIYFYDALNTSVKVLPLSCLSSPTCVPTILGAITGMPTWYPLGYDFINGYVYTLTNSPSTLIRRYQLSNFGTGSTAFTRSNTLTVLGGIAVSGTQVIWAESSQQSQATLWYTPDGGTGPFKLLTNGIIPQPYSLCMDTGSTVYVIAQLGLWRADISNFANAIYVGAYPTNLTSYYSYMTCKYRYGTLYVAVNSLRMPYKVDTGTGVWTALSLGSLGTFSSYDNYGFDVDATQTYLYWLNGYSEIYRVDLTQRIAPFYVGYYYANGSPSEFELDNGADGSYYFGASSYNLFYGKLPFGGTFASTTGTGSNYYYYYKNLELDRVGKRIYFVSSSYNLYVSSYGVNAVPRLVHYVGSSIASQALYFPPQGCVGLPAELTAPTNFTNVNCTNNGPHGSACTLGCAPGLVANGDTRTACVSGNWYSVSARCQPLCTSPPPTPTGYTLGNCLSNQAAGYSCTLGCLSPDYLAVSSLTTTCIGGSSWQAPIGRCEHRCDVPADISNYSAPVNIGTCNSIGSPGSLCSFGCNSPWLVGNSRFLQCSNGSWVYYSGGTQTCVPPNCNSINTVSTNMGNCSTQANGLDCVLGCNAGYKPQGSLATRCISNPPTPASFSYTGSCIRIPNCSAPIPGFGGAFPGTLQGTCINNPLENTTCRLNCDVQNGYFGTGLLDLRCDWGGIWIPSPYVCRLMGPNLPPPVNFDAVGADQFVTIPNFTTAILVKVAGGSGATGYYVGSTNLQSGAGGYVLCAFPPPAGVQTLTLKVASGGSVFNYNASLPFGTPGGGGWPNGGGCVPAPSPSYGPCGGGGGRSQVSAGGTILAVAGGGGASTFSSYYGGAAGGATGVANGGCSAGSQTTGGSGYSGYGPGSFLQGGYASGSFGYSCTYSLAGGGDGYYGGGAGGNAYGGCGGSSYLGGCTGGAYLTAANLAGDLTGIYRNNAAQYVFGSKLAGNPGLISVYFYVTYPQCASDPCLTALDGLNYCGDGGNSLVNCTCHAPGFLTINGGQACLRVCPSQPSNPFGGNFAAGCANSTVNSTCVLNCTSFGWIPTGDAVCLNTGLWSYQVCAPPGSCLGPPPNPSFGSYPSDGTCVGQQNGTVCPLSCGAGYNPSGNSVCLGGTWSTQTCIPKPCVTVVPPTPLGTYSPICAGTVSGGTCPLTCTTGARATGPAVCNLGVWTGATCYYPNCTAQPAPPKNGFYPITCPLIGGSSCPLSCNVGTPTGTPTCTNDGSWTSASCLNPSDPNNCQINVVSPITLGSCATLQPPDSSCTLGCGGGLAPVGNFSIGCPSRTGIITPAFTGYCGPPPCVGCPCGNFTIPTSQRFVWAAGTCLGALANGAKCVLDCQVGYTKPAVPLEIVCQDGNWLYPAADCISPGGGKQPTSAAPALYASPFLFLVVGVAAVL